MANFSTHLAVGAVSSGLAATVTLAAGLVSPDQLSTLTMAGVIGSVLPDIDLERSTPSRMLFGALGILFAFVTLFHYYTAYSVVELWLIWMGVYLFVRIGLWHLFHENAVHRGIFHSVLAGCFFMVTTATLLTFLMGRDPLIAWLAGTFVLFGYVVHLVLDEIYSVDFDGVHIKRSFGSALKLYQQDSPRASLLMAGALLLAIVVAPPINSLVRVVTSQETGAFFRERIWPDGKWFAPPSARAGQIKPDTHPVSPNSSSR